MPDLARDLRAAEDELAPARRLKANLAAFIHNPAYDLHFRTALAQAVGLPRPTKEHTP